MDIKIINPIEYKNWDDLLISCPGYSFFHSSSWAKVLSESYGYIPHYVTLLDGEKIIALIPIMEINSFVTGKRGVSLPFTDYCNPIIHNGISFPDLFEFILGYGRDRRWKTFELRGGQNLLPHSSASSTFLGNALELSRDETHIFSNFRDSTKRNMKKAIKEGVDVTISHSLGSVKEFYRLNGMTRKEHGLPPQPFSFFKNVYTHIISKNFGFVALASYKGTVVAGAVYFHFGQKALYKYGASDKNYQHVRANNLVMSQAIKWYCQNGYGEFCFGRTETDNAGLRQFKAGWGATEYLIKYSKYDLVKDAFIEHDQQLQKLANKIFTKMPVPLLNIVGSLLYRHVG